MRPFTHVHAAYYALLPQCSKYCLECQREYAMRQATIGARVGWGTVGGLLCFDLPRFVVPESP